ncbi:MAG: putative 2-oxoglutarate/Fe(II)-dependent dioxygenase YbiX [Paracoccaceae bacterium]|jgi:predicted 2-oxoglutarate/Fe(II)-dependent dioxygenase YbiX
MLNSPSVYKTYKKVFTTAECLKIEEAARQYDTQSGTVATKTSNEEFVVDNRLRNSDILFFSEPWIVERVQNVVLRANREAKWNVSVSDLEPMQYGEYAPGGYYDWHFDALGYPYDANSMYPGKVRKLSVSVLINDAREFEGGEFEVNAGFQETPLASNVVNIQKPGRHGGLSQPAPPPGASGDEGPEKKSRMLDPGPAIFLG